MKENLLNQLNRILKEDYNNELTSEELLVSGCQFSEFVRLLYEKEEDENQDK